MSYTCERELYIYFLFCSSSLCILLFYSTDDFLGHYDKHNSTIPMLCRCGFRLGTALSRNSKFRSWLYVACRCLQRRKVVYKIYHIIYVRRWYYNVIIFETREHNRCIFPFYLQLLRIRDLSSPPPLIYNVSRGVKKKTTKNPENPTTIRVE